ncbi:MAG: HAMP domain-containing histidine kinase [Alloprevotella sp.]|nr:HAMP domain-containing histidine kinase [Alloprevotella sp.]MBR1651983.1 HAMP domain-containing histidine kinase [Alloprevotella sp.]
MSAETILKVSLSVGAAVIAAASLVVSNVLIRDLIREEQQSMEVWAEAMSAFQRADENTDLGLVLKVMNGNNTIPVIVVDEAGNILAARNVGLPQDSLENVLAGTSAESQRFVRKLRERAQDMQRAGNAIRLSLTDDAATEPAEGASVLVCYEQSLMLRRLATFPYVQLGVVALFILVAILALLSIKRAEQNKVWVGLSRETAHQLGTPISSLMAGSEILKDSYPDDPLLPEMDKDIRRLQLIAERFSKIGSTPRLEDENLCDVIRHVADYIGRRASDKVAFTLNFPSDNVPVRINAPLFEWVVENLCKNAIDAMQGEGSITVYVYTRGNRVAIEVTDTGKGIARRDWRNVFRPGFTTKRRGWGLGLSLARRIVEDYHCGRIFVQWSEPGRGTTFCILLRKV